MEINKLMTWSSPDDIPVAWLNALYDVPDWESIRRELSNGKTEGRSSH